MKYRRNLALSILLLLTTTPLVAADEKSASAEAAEFQQVYDQWQELLGDAAVEQTKFVTVPQAEHGAAREKVLAALKKAGDLAPKLQAAAEKAYLANDKNEKVAHLLFAMALTHARNDNYEEALRLAQLLIDHNYSPPDIHLVHRIAASAAFATMNLDEAKKHIEAAVGDKDIQKDEDLLKLLAAIEYYKPLWEHEQKIREAEKKADDLPRVKLKTSKGDIVVELFENEAPNTVANFISLVENGFYDNTQFHRVIPSFVAQGGDPFSKDPVANAGKIGHGGPTYTIACECVRPDHRKHFRGVLSMAHTGPNTGGSQFFLTLTPTMHLDGGHTVFGRVIEGIDVLGKIQRVDPEKSAGEIPDTTIKAEVLRKRDHEYKPQPFGAEAEKDAAEKDASGK